MSQPRTTAAPRLCHHADQIGADYVARVTADHRKEHGLYLTPLPVADFMAGQITTSGEHIRILDPAAGAGILLCAAIERLVTHAPGLKRLEVVAYEVNQALADLLRGVLEARAWAKKHGVALQASIVPADFVLAHATALSSIGGFLPHLRDGEAFDIVIANPPYFKLNKADPRAQAAAAVVHGQPNIYGLFMAIGAALLKDGGQFVFIVPRSFASGPFFRRFREMFFDCIRRESVHVFGSRRDAFNRDAVLQENVIFKGLRQDGWSGRPVSEVMAISSSQGVGDLAEAQRRIDRLLEVLDLQSAEKVLRLPVSGEEDEFLRMVDAWPGSLNAYGLKISTGPVVPFRATAFLAKAGAPKTHVPLLWMNHV